METYKTKRQWGTPWTLVLGFLAGIHFTAGTTVSFGQELRLARQVDHIIIRANDPERLFLLLTETLELPVAWPLKPYGFFVSGGVFAGNVNLEVLRMGPRSKTSPDGPSDAKLYGIAFEPHDSIEASIQFLKAKKLRHGPPMPFAGEHDGEREVLWTNVSLPSLQVQDSMIFLCKYARDVDEHREPLRDQLRKRGGGPLGLELVEEISVGVADLETVRAVWGQHLGPATPENPSIWRLGDGPAIRLVTDDKDVMRGIVLRVRSMERAKTQLSKRGLLGDGVGQRISIAGSTIGALDIRLVE